MTERDAAWMAKILARFTDERIEALLGEARADTPRSSELSRILNGRRDRILRRGWSGSRRSPTRCWRPGTALAGSACRTVPRRREWRAAGPVAAVWSIPQAVRSTVEPAGLRPRPGGYARPCGDRRPQRPERPGPARVHVRPGRVVGLERPEEQSLRPREAGR